MSYFIFNNVHSDDMKVIVENLPPVIRAPQRYNRTEIEGRDGAIIEQLGYKDYEKEIKIAFKSEDDIWNTMEWLIGKGRLIFSNEQDKYYDAHILDQIDYERALRFRKATVSFLVQPYKHSLDEEETTSRILINQGNVACNPLITVYGSGKVDLLVNGVKSCSVTINEYITLDGEKQEAYKGNTLQNRLMIGEFPTFTPGENVLSFIGNVTNVITLVRSRWI